MARYVDGFVLPVPKKTPETVSSRTSCSSPAHRDRVNAKVMKPARIANMGPPRCRSTASALIYGGFKVVVDA